MKTMTRRELVDAVAHIAGVSPTTISPTLYGGLQSKGLLPLGGKGEVVDLSASHRVNLLLGAVLDRPHGASAGDAVEYWRTLPLAREPQARGLADNLGLDFANAGTALDSIVANIQSWAGRSPILEAKAGGEIAVAAEFHAAHMSLVFYGPTGKPMGSFVFGSESTADAGRVERISRILHPVFVRLAEASQP